MSGLDLEVATREFELIKKLDDGGNERWSARMLGRRLGYSEYRHFLPVIEKAKIACKNSGQSVVDHFEDYLDMIQLGKTGSREMADINLSRYACYLIMQNADPTKEIVAMGQTYFAIQTRKQEVFQENAKELERLTAREKLSETEKRFSGVMFERGIDGRGIAAIRAKGDKVLFGGNSTDDMKKKMAIPGGRALADFLPTITIKAKDLTAEMTTFKTKEKSLSTQPEISLAHESHNPSVRRALVDEGIFPEKLPKEEDIKKLERKVKKINSLKTGAISSLE